MSLNPLVSGVGDHACNPLYVPASHRRTKRFRRSFPRSQPPSYANRASTTRAPVSDTCPIRLLYLPASVDIRREPQAPPGLLPTDGTDDGRAPIECPAITRWRQSRQ